MSELAIETVAKIFIVLVVLSLSIVLITKFYNDVTKINLVDEDREGQQTLGPLDSTTSEAVGALASSCYKKYRAEAAKGKENVCYFLFSSGRRFDEMGLTGDAIIASSGLNGSRLEVKSLAGDKLLVIYQLDSDKVIIR